MPRRQMKFGMREMQVIQSKSGSSIGVNDFVIPEEKAKIIDDSEKEVKAIEKQFDSGLVTRGERYNKVIDIWSRANEQVAKAMMEKISTETAETPDGKNVEQSSFNSVSQLKGVWTRQR